MAAASQYSPFHGKTLWALLFVPLALAWWTPASSPGQEADPLWHEVQQLSPRLMTLKSAPDETFRIIIYRQGWEHLTSRIYLQWLTTSDSSREPQVSTTVAVEEIGAFWSVGEPMLQRDNNKTNITLHATHTYTQEQARIRITVLASGRYTARIEQRSGSRSRRATPQGTPTQKRQEQ